MEFTYKAKSSIGEIFEGTIDASNESAAVTILHGKGWTVFSLNPVKRNLFSIDLNEYLQRPGSKDVVMFTRQLSTLIDADMPLAEGLRTLSIQMEKPSFKKMILNIAESVESGSSLSGALANYPRLFSPFYIRLVQSGEISGKLHNSLNYLAEYLEKSQAISSKLKGALAYPVFVLFALVVVTFIMVIYVLPQLLTIFKDVGNVDLPLTTRVLIFAIDFINNNLAFLVVGFLLLVFGIVAYLRTPAGRVWYDKAKVRMPSLGIVVRNLYLARIAESLTTLIGAGISILDALQITADLVGNISYRNIIIDAQANVRNGGTISEIFSQHKEEIPPLFTSMTAIGEKTGKLDGMLQHVAKFYKSESDNAIDSISQLIEPVMVVLLGFGVAVLVSSILLPIYSLVGAG
ncbi:MAG TPA: type II secretion system F family protein [Candidatus Paceibacterota bacterium]